jgi:MFS family permease
MSRSIPNAYNFFVVLYVALGSIASAYGLSIFGSTIGQPSFYTSLNLAPPGAPSYDRTARLFGAFTGVNVAGACLGAIFNSWSADRFGRKRTIQFGAVVLSIGAALCAGSVDVGMYVTLLSFVQIELMH